MMVRWGILGTAQIARRRAIPAIQATTNGTVAAIASRQLEKARETAAALNIPLAFGSYDELVASDEVDIIYVPLPNDMHLEWTCKALAAGKAVLCEKPLALDAAQVASVVAAANESGRFCMEALASHFHPVHSRVAELMGEGRIGEICFVRMSLGWSFEGNRTDFRWNKAQGGGGLLDLGCYCVHTASDLLGATPTTVSARAMFDPETDVDANMAILLGYPGERSVLIDCGILSGSRNQYEVIGTKGRIVVETPFGNGVETRPLTLFDGRGQAVLREEPTRHQLQAQFAAVADAVKNGAPPPVSLASTLATTRVLDACFASARAGGEQVKLA
ncbi:MAG TPA: Gfo/Idh/MocA family oxidoreductase [Limnochordia bacterium]|nr:Gfo/Idh/MocA family oxidoreductase [Limnochordia bacterium]